MQIYISNFKLWSLKMLAYVKKYHIHLIAFSNKIGGGKTNTTSNLSDLQSS